MSIKMLRIGDKEFKINLPRPNDLGSTFQKIFGHEDIYQFGSQVELRLTKKDIVIDGGAHIGLFTLLLSQYAGTVYAVEPEFANCEYLVGNMKLNEIENVVLLREALASKTEERDFLVSCKSPAIGSFYKYYFFNDDGDASVTRKVQCITLEDIFAKYGINFCKMVKLNIEGAEFEVLLNLPEYVYRRVGFFLLEVHDKVTAHRFSELEKKLSENGFVSSILEERGDHCRDENHKEFLSVLSVRQENK